MDCTVKRFLVFVSVLVGFVPAQFLSLFIGMVFLKWDGETCFELITDAIDKMWNWANY